MDQVTNSLGSAWDSFVNFLPNLIGGIALILVAWVIATLVKKAVAKGLKAIDFDNRLQKWGAANTEEQANQSIDSLAKVFYYLVWVLFLPSIFNVFGLRSVAAPISNMINTALAYLPNIIAAAFLIVIAVVVGRFVKNLVYNLALSMNVDRMVDKFTGGSDNVDASEVTPSRKQKDTIAKVLANIVYILILIPILTVALEALNIRSISTPIINVMNSILAAIPNILVAVILLGVGIVIAKFVGDLVADLLQGTGINKLSTSLSPSGRAKIDLAQVIGQVVAVLIGLFFFVEALNALNLAVLNTIGAAIISYIPNLLFALIILGLGIVGGQLLGNFITRSAGSKWLGALVQYLLIAFAVFMALDQLNFATSIVNAAFIFLIGGAAVAFAIAFGVGGRDFARNQLRKLESKMDREAAKNETPDNDMIEQAKDEFKS